MLINAPLLHPNDLWAPNKKGRRVLKIYKIVLITNLSWLEIGYKKVATDVSPHLFLHNADNHVISSCFLCGGRHAQIFIFTYFFSTEKVFEWMSLKIIFLVQLLHFKIHAYQWRVCTLVNKSLKMKIFILRRIFFFAPHFHTHNVSTKNITWAHSSRKVHTG